MFGLIGEKVGMTQLFDDRGLLQTVTIIRVDPNLVVERRTPERDGYSATLLGAGDVKPQRLHKPVLGQFESRKIVPKRHLFEFRDFDREASVGSSFDISLFEEVSFVDIVGFTKGRGYQGVMKRHGFSGGRATHGSKFHRAGGSTGMAAFPARVMKGTKMAGRMGRRRATVQNLRVIKIDREQHLLIVGGSAPGVRGGCMLLFPSIKKG